MLAVALIHHLYRQLSGLIATDGESISRYPYFSAVPVRIRAWVDLLSALGAQRKSIVPQIGKDKRVACASQDFGVHQLVLVSLVILEDRMSI